MKEIDSSKYSLGIALSGGGARGVAHLGVLQALEEINIKPSIISGCSAGALAGALYADGNSPQEILAFFRNKAFKEFAKLTIAQTGLFQTEPFRNFLKKHLKSHTFEGLKIPLKIVATDIAEGKTVTFEEGSLIEPILASCAYPIVFTPIEIDGVNYVDGGLFKNFPVSLIRSECSKVIGVNVSPLTKQEFRNSLLYIAERSLHHISVANSIDERLLCDMLLEMSNLSSYAMFSLDHTDQIFELGYEFAKMELEKKEYQVLLDQLQA